MDKKQSKTTADKFKVDLRSKNLEEVIQKHVSTGPPRGLTEDEYFDLRSIVANHFDLHPSNVVVVGSARLGFSLNPKKLYDSYDLDSDIDVAVVSSNKFDYYWDAVFRYSLENEVWNRDQGGKFRKILFKGWIDPRFLPAVPIFNEAESWSKFFNDLMNSRQFGLRQITARVYRNWDRLEAYQSRSISRCKILLEKEASHG